MINKLIKTIMAKKTVSTETKKTEVPAIAVEQTKKTEVSDELTQEILDKAISIHNVSSSSNLPWEEISQEERWNHIKEARK